MNRPITVIYEDFKRDLADLINSSGLPAFVVEFVLQSYLNEAKAVAKKQYESDKALYESSLESNKETVE